MRKILSSILIVSAFLGACGASKWETVAVSDQEIQKYDGAQAKPGANPPAAKPAADNIPSENPLSENPSEEAAAPVNDGGASGGLNPPSGNAPDQGSGDGAVAVSIPQGGVTSIDATELQKGGPFSKVAAGGAVDIPSSGRLHVFSLVQDGGGYFTKRNFLYHVAVSKNYKGALWGSAAAGQYIPAPYEGDKLLDLNESPAVTRTKTATHIVSRSGDKIVYWECANGLLDAASQDGGQIQCAKKVVNGGDNAKVQGCVAITSDPYGRVYIFAKHNPSGRLEIYQGTGVEDMHSAGSIFSAAEIQSCPAAAYHPAMNRVYVFGSHDGDLFAGYSDPISDAGPTVGFHEGDMTAARKFNGGMSSCGENGRLTALYNPKTKKMSLLHHEKGGSNTAIQSFGFEDELTGFKANAPLLQKQLSQLADDGDNIDDYPVGVYDESGVPHVFADKAYSDGFYEAEKTSGGIQSFEVIDDQIKVERAPAAVFDTDSKVIHLFGRQTGENALAHFVKKRRADGSWSPWHAEALAQGIDFQGCPAALIEN